jgi:hypothetical protein
METPRQGFSNRQVAAGTKPVFKMGRKPLGAGKYQVVFIRPNERLVQSNTLEYRL